MTEKMECSESGAWQITKEKLIKEIMATYEAIANFKSHETKSAEQLEAMSMNELSAVLKDENGKLDKLVSEWDIKK